MKDQQAAAVKKDHAAQTLDAGALTQNPNPSTVDQVRSWPVMTAHEQSDAPSGYVPIAGDEKSNFRHVPANQWAETKDALEECATKGAALKTELGQFAPAAEMAGLLRAQLVEARTANLKAQENAAYCSDKEDVAGNDAMLYLDRVQTNLENAEVHVPGIAKKYPAMMALIEQRKKAIVDGIARAKAEKAATEAAAKK